MNMRPSRVLAKLRAGESVFSFKLNFADAREAEMTAMAGFDCIWTDLEHVPNNLAVAEQQVWASKAHNADVVVRIERGSYSDYIRPLEMDATGIMVPHVMTAEDARQLVRTVRFHPLGRRPLDGGNADGGFLFVNPHDYTAQANTERFVIAQIEDPEAMDELEGIAAVDGIDMLFFGPGDFSHSIGKLGQLRDPEVCAARARVAEVARAHGKFAGTTGSPETMRELLDLGYRFINLGSDVRGLRDYLVSLMAAVQQVTA